MKQVYILLKYKKGRFLTLSEGSSFREEGSETETDVSEDGGGGENEVGGYEEMNMKGLKSLCNERNIDMTGMKLKKHFVSALEKNE